MDFCANAQCRVSLGPRHVCAGNGRGRSTPTGSRLCAGCNKRVGRLESEERWRSTPRGAGVRASGGARAAPLVRNWWRRILTFRANARQRARPVGQPICVGALRGERELAATDVAELVFWLARPHVLETDARSNLGGSKRRMSGWTRGRTCGCTSSCARRWWRPGGSGRSPATGSARLTPERVGARCSALVGFTGTTNNKVARDSIAGHACERGVTGGSGSASALGSVGRRVAVCGGGAVWSAAAAVQSPSACAAVGAEQHGRHVGGLPGSGAPPSRGRMPWWARLPG